MLDRVRLEATANMDRRQRSELGQFLTPSNIARFMAALFRPSDSDNNIEDARLLDAGAGVGSLSAAFLDRWTDGGFRFRSVSATAYEVDDSLRVYLVQTLKSYADRFKLSVSISGDDFVESAVNQLQFQKGLGFTHAILNPPYKKIATRSRHRLLLRQAGIETVNLYTAFVALAVSMLAPGGQLVAIIPRSFCNGPYYRPFREFLMKRAAIHHIHLFASRNKAFKDDDVLQENIILLLERDAEQGAVKISTSTDDSFADYMEHDHPFDRVVFPGDIESFIHVPTTPEHSAMELSSAFVCSLADIGMNVSTGPVVDFRLKEFLRMSPESGTVPLLYPAHFTGQRVEWPKEGIKKPNAMVHNSETEKWLYPNGFYVVVRRFSSKEEKRRIVASLVSPELCDTTHIGFENHLNVFHYSKHGLSEDIACGLMVYLNSTTVDDHFRRFSGHTQVNATDLRLMKYPKRKTLAELGCWAKERGELTQQQIDEKVGSIA